MLCELSKKSFRVKETINGAVLIVFSLKSRCRMASLYLVGADKAALDQWELRLLRPVPIGSQVGAREKWKTFWVSGIGQTASFKGSLG